MWDKPDKLNMWNIDFKSIKTWKKKLNKTNMWKQKQNKKNKKKKKGFLGNGLHTQEQACVHGQDYAYASSCLENPKNTAKPKTLNLTP